MTCAIKGGKRTRKQRRSRRSGGKKQQKGGGLLSFFGIGKNPEQAPTSVNNPPEKKELDDNAGTVSSTPQDNSLKEQSAPDQLPKKQNSILSFFGIGNKQTTTTTTQAQAPEQAPAQTGGKRKTHKKSRKH